MSQALFSFFSVAALIGALTIILPTRPRYTAMMLWLEGIFASGILIGMGFDFLALLQVMASTGVALLFFFFSSFIGLERKYSNHESKKRNILMLSLFVIFGSLLFLFYKNELPFEVKDYSSVPTLVELTSQMVSKYFSVFIVLFLIVMTSLIGIGVTARSEENQ